MIIVHFRVKSDNIEEVIITERVQKVFCCLFSLLHLQTPHRAGLVDNEDEILTNAVQINSWGEELDEIIPEGDTHTNPRANRNRSVRDPKIY